jgi:GNAT superfamily N-acetyltransferase
MNQTIELGAPAIGPAKREDIPALIFLLGELFSIEQDFRPDAERQRRGLELLLAEPRACVLVCRGATGEVLGMISAQLVISTAEGAPSAWFEDLVVSRLHRGSGLGERLLEEALAWARTQGATRAQLLADLDNAPALGFYRHQGWNPTRLGAWRCKI